MLASQKNEVDIGSDRHYKSSFSCIICGGGSSSVRFVDEIRVRTERRVSWNVELSIFPQECSSSQTMAESYSSSLSSLVYVVRVDISSYYDL